MQIKLQGTDFRRSSSVDSIGEDLRDQFEQMLDWAWEHEADLSTAESDFVDGMRDKFVRYGERTRVSKAQYDWLNDICNKLEA